MANQFLIKETMVDMRALSAAEITALEAGTYKGVQLLGSFSIDLLEILMRITLAVKQIISMPLAVF